MSAPVPPRILGRAKGFTLIEVMIAVVVIGLLAAVAYPSYQDAIRKSRRADAKAALSELTQFMERIYTENNTYKPDGANPEPPFTQTPKDGTGKYYDLSLTASSATTFTLQAAPISGTSQANDGLLQIDNTGARWWDKNNNGAKDSGENSW